MSGGQKILKQANSIHYEASLPPPTHPPRTLFPYLCAAQMDLARIGINVQYLRMDGMGAKTKIGWMLFYTVLNVFYVISSLLCIYLSFPHADLLDCDKLETGPLSLITLIRVFLRKKQILGRR